MNGTIIYKIKEKTYINLMLMLMLMLIDLQKTASTASSFHDFVVGRGQTAFLTFIKQ